jgi:hypothetical protein
MAWAPQEGKTAARRDDSRYKYRATHPALDFGIQLGNPEGKVLLLALKLIA